MNKDNPNFRTNEEWFDLCDRQSQEIASLKENIKEYEWFVSQVNKYVMAGEVDSQDASLRLFKELNSEITSLKSKERLHDTIMTQLQRAQKAYTDKLEFENHRLRSALEIANQFIDSCRYDEDGNIGHEHLGDVNSYAYDAQAKITKALRGSSEKEG